jgi:hypothetical protein
VASPARSELPLLHLLFQRRMRLETAVTEPLWCERRIFTPHRPQGGARMSEPTTTCYAVTVATDIPVAGDNPPFTIYLVLTENEELAAEAVAAKIPATWSVTNVRRTAIQNETIERLGLRPGHVRHL